MSTGAHGLALADRNVPRNGWQHQAERLALTHTAVMTTAQRD